MYMSLATLKKKSGTKYSKNMGEPVNGFSLQGKLRIFGTPGNTNLAKSVTRTPFKGPLPVGHGGCCGGYDQHVSKSGHCCIPQTMVKPSTLSSKGMLTKRRMCCNPTVKSLTPLDQNRQIINYRNKWSTSDTSDNYATKNCKKFLYYEDYKPSYTKNLSYNISSSEYIQNRNRQSC